MKRNTKTIKSIFWGGFLLAGAGWLAALGNAGGAEPAAAKSGLVDLSVLRADYKDNMYIYTSRDWRDTLWVYLKNPTPAPLEIKEIYAQGVRLPCFGEANDMAKTGIMWADLAPGNLNPGAWNELKVRYLGRSGISNTLQLKMILKDDKVIEETVPVIEEPAVKITSYCFDREYKQLLVYVRLKKGGKIEKILVSGEDLTGKTTQRAVAGASLCLLRIALSQAVPWGDYRIVKVVTDQGANACLVKAIEPSFFIGMWCGDMCPKFAKGETPSEAWLQDHLDHYVTTLASGWLHQADLMPGGPEGALKLLAKYKLNYCGNRWGDIPGFGNITDRSKRLGNDPRLSFWEVFDEPGWHCDDAWPAEFLRTWVWPYRRLTKQPTYGSHGSYGIMAPPCYGNGYFLFRDYDCTDLASLFRYPVEAEPGPLHSVETELDALRIAVDPKPVSLIAQSWKDRRWPTPDEERLMVYMAVAHGAKGISYFAYNFGEANGVGNSAEPEAKKLWAEMKNINLELTLLGDLLVKSEIAPLCPPSQDKLETVALLAGEEAVVVVALNHDYEYTKDSFTPHALTNVQVEARLPAWFKAEDVFEIGAAGLKKIKYESAGGKLTFPLDEIRTARVVVLSGEPKLFERIKDRFAQLQKR